MDDMFSSELTESQIKSWSDMRKTFEEAGQTVESIELTTVVSSMEDPLTKYAITFAIGDHSTYLAGIKRL